MAQTIRLKRSSTPGNTWANAPTFLSGEMALNTNDKKLWVGDVDNTSAIEILTDASTEITLETLNLTNSSIQDETGTTTSTSATTIATFDGGTFGTGKFIIQVKDTITGDYQSSELSPQRAGVLKVST